MLALTGHGLRWALAAVFGAVLVALCEVTRSAVAHRRRAALSDRALVVDANLRTVVLGGLIASIVFLVKASPRPPRRFPWPDRALAGVVPAA